jgi:hypothetical protein
MTDQDDPGRAYESRRWDLGGGAHVVAAVNDDGTEDFWFLDPKAADGQWYVPPHENTGPLGGAMAARVALWLSRHPEAEKNRRNRLKEQR